MEFDNNTPIYIQVMNMLKKQIVSGELQNNEKLPSVRELAVMLKVNPNTIQRTYQELEKEGITVTQRGLGRYVTADIARTQTLKEEMSAKLIGNFLQEMKGLGFSKEEIIRLTIKNSEDLN